MFHVLKSRLLIAYRFLATAKDIASTPALLIVGLARGNPFSRYDRGVFSRVGARFFSELTVRPRCFFGTPVSLSLCDLGHLVSFEEVVVANAYNLDRLPFNPEIIFDCGAHIGLFTVLASSRWPFAQIFAFEPSPTNFVWLNRNASRSSGNISCFQMAVGISDDKAIFYEGESNSGSLCRSSTTAANSVVVQVADMCRLIDRIAGKSLLLKLDVEGSEREILPEIVSGLPSNCAIYFETHHGEIGWLEAVRILTNAGFEVTNITHRGAFYDGFAIRSLIEEGPELCATP
jgi:FkbM family methyltransferase